MSDHGRTETLFLGAIALACAAALALMSLTSARQHGTEPAAGTAAVAAAEPAS